MIYMLDDVDGGEIDAEEWVLVAEVEWSRAYCETNPS